MKIKKKDLKDAYGIVLNEAWEGTQCLRKLEELGLGVNYNSLFGYTHGYKKGPFYITYDWYCEQFCCSACRGYRKKIIKYKDFNNIFSILKQQENIKDYKLNDKGQIIKINNYNSNETVYIINYIDYDNYIDETIIKTNNKEFLDKCINIGFIFNTKENIEKFIKYIKNY